MIYVSENIDIDELCKGWKKLEGGMYLLEDGMGESIFITPHNRAVYNYGYTSMLRGYLNKGIFYESDHIIIDPEPSDEKFPIVTLCGSTKFVKEFRREAKRLTMQGNIVLNLEIFSHSEDKESINVQNLGQSRYTQILSVLEELQKEKIKMCDKLLVINKNGYIGESTKKEIEFAKSLGKEILYMEPGWEY